MDRPTILFGDVLEALGATNTDPVEKSRYWEFYNVNYPTPAGQKPASYLRLAHDCPISEASSRNLAHWRSFAREGWYTIVVTKKSDRAQDLKKTTQEFKG